MIRPCKGCNEELEDHQTISCDYDFFSNQTLVVIIFGTISVTEPDTFHPYIYVICTNLETMNNCLFPQTTKYGW